MRKVSLQCVCVLAAIVAVAGCGEGPDCRHKSMECAEGFACEESGGEWLCTKEVELPKTVEEEAAGRST